MASEKEASCESDPNFAVICGFLEKFGTTCGLTNIDFVDLQDMLENTQEGKAIFCAIGKDYVLDHCELHSNYLILDNYQQNNTLQHSSPITYRSFEYYLESI